MDKVLVTIADENGIVLGQYELRNPDTINADEVENLDADLGDDLDDIADDLKKFFKQPATPSTTASLADVEKNDDTDEKNYYEIEKKIESRVAVLSSAIPNNPEYKDILNAEIHGLKVALNMVGAALLVK